MEVGVCAKLGVEIGPEKCGFGGSSTSGHVLFCEATGWRCDDEDDCGGCC